MKIKKEPPLKNIKVICLLYYNIWTYFFKSDSEEVTIQLSNSRVIISEQENRIQSLVSEIEELKGLLSTF